jgi:hypothetical protein
MDDDDVKIERDPDDPTRWHIALPERVAKVFRGEIEPPSDAEVIRILARVLGREPTHAEIGRVFAAVERTAQRVTDDVMRAAGVSVAS